MPRWAIANTRKPRCKAYLAIELASINSTALADCGGRAPDNDVMDTTYSVLAAGLTGFNLTADPPTALFTDGATAHTDYTPDFPFFGPPH